MSRRRSADKRSVTADARYGDVLLSCFMNKMMKDGKKSVAERIVYGALDAIALKEKGTSPLEIFHEALANVQPDVEVRSRRVGGATYQVPVEVSDERGRALAMRWLIASSVARGEGSMAACLSGELLDAWHKRGASIKKREDTHRMAEANRAFSHYRW
ncbi:MAG: 30S ribosomal protein S7 [Alphaproteobacteria bacterium GM7ARS4]|nr:30S ribosomal protein S7 [Alphaproteobacteria bacterium GM7ARS4]